MAWTNAQKALAAQACKAAGLDESSRRLILMQFPHARITRDGRAAAEPTSTSPLLNNSDFEQFMAIVEEEAGGQVVLPAKAYEPGHFARKADDDLARMRGLVHRIDAALLTDRPDIWHAQSLAGWIAKRVTRDRTDQLAELTYQELHALINGLRNFARNSGLTLAA